MGALSSTAKATLAAFIPEMDDGDEQSFDVAFIPVIDISGYLKGDKRLTRLIAGELRSACTFPGFFQITGHQVPGELQTRLFKKAAEFYALPGEKKLALHRDHSNARRGYEGIGDQQLEKGILDQKEGFSIGPEWEKDERFLQGPNQWPSEDDAPGFQQTYMEYFNAVLDLSKIMFRLMALSLDLEETYFDDFVGSKDAISVCRVHQYPPTTPELVNKTRGIGAHTDFGAMTMLLQDSVGGLEVFHRPTKTWHSVRPIKDAFVVNMGDMMERWTNNTYTSTLHRVISPVTKQYRYSCAFFNEGLLDQVIECIPTLLKPGEKPLYDPVRVEDYLRSRYDSTYDTTLHHGPGVPS